MTSPSNNKWTQAKLNLLSEALNDNFEKLISYFSLDVRQTPRMYIGPCPIHTGDNMDALNFYHSGHSHRGNWCCNTRGCEAVFQPSALGFVRGLLSNIELQWSGQGDEVYPFMDTVNWSLKFLGINGDSLKVDSAAVETNRFISHTHVFSRRRPDGKFNISRGQIRKRLDIPAKQLIDDGFSPAIIDAYDIGTCNQPNKDMNERIVFPVYDEVGASLVGCIGRSIWNKCQECGLWHNPDIDCPPKEYAQKYAKWRNSDGFKSEYWLYNYDKAAPHISKTGIVIIVEGPKDVLRLEEAGIHNAVATFGAKLSDGQKDLLDSSGAFTIILLTDPDEAGIVARDSIAERCRTQYNILTPDLGENDVGATSVDDLQMMIIPLIEQYKIEL